MQLEWPYTLPVWRNAHHAPSPDGHFDASITNAVEVSMGNSTHGTLLISTGLTLQHCNPSFLWSEDSGYLVVPQYVFTWGFQRRQRLLVIAVSTNTVLVAPVRAWYFMPERFTAAELVVTANPFGHSKQLSWPIPSALRSFKTVSLAP